MEIKYDEEMQVYFISQEGKPLIDTKGNRKEWIDLEEADKYMANLYMIPLIYGDQ